MRIAVIFPSRGLVFSQTAQELLDNLRGYDYKIFFSHRKPIPQCFNDPLEQALEDESFTHVWIVEDDMVLSRSTLKKLIRADEDVVTIDYPVSKQGQGAVVRSFEGNVLFCGTGCLLIKRDVFERLKKPYFTTDIHWTIQNHENYIYLGASEREDDGRYGTHDVNFSMKLYQAGIVITVLPGRLGQRKLISLGKAGSNNGAHSIEVWKKIKKDYYLNEIRKSEPLPSSNLVSVQTETGIIETSKSNADRLSEQGIGEIITQPSVVVDFGDTTL